MYPMFILQESALAHVELPTTVETVEAAIKKHKDFTTTMELNLHRIKAVIEAGESLISQSNIYSERIRERIDTLANRYINKNVLKSNKVNKGKESVFVLLSFLFHQEGLKALKKLSVSMWQVEIMTEIKRKQIF